MPSKTTILAPALALIAALGLSTPVAAAADGTWRVELRAVSLIPVGDDGTLEPVAGLGSGNRTEIDMLDTVSPELAVSADVSRSFDLSLSIALHDQDVELDVSNGGEVPLGSVDSVHVLLSGMFDVASWKNSVLSVGPVVAYASHDDVDVDPATRAAEGVVDATMDDALLVGIEGRLDTSVGTRGWFFTSSLRWLTGDAEMDVFTDSDASGPSTTGRVLAARGDAELDPLVVSLGFGRRF